MGRKGLIGLLVLLIILTMAACSNIDEKIVGKWEDNFFGYITYDFKSDGTFKLDTGEEIVKGKFSTSGDKLTLEAKGDKIVGNYSIEDGILTISSEDGEEFELVRAVNDKK
ncbi:hypothetical protein JSQ81_16215 [Sporosarcina sp. Marseille-Q4063]|uniref:hypothetical protein n=1 Tax=Sporosarcina sp. Marseille-Q4063 TaxID=2810514 RepID=UPI001BB05797|nr:hypothetical protein [Sporosarcina sp. Marseille-Q4063]QUW21334.1 hypothetical protein JSQ81_16215 [Sporosarcina sp. Marseille-Q4063]